MATSPLPLEDEALWMDDGASGDDVSKMSTEEITIRTKMLNEQIRYMKSEILHVQHEIQAKTQQIKENTDKIKVNKAHPHLVSHVVELLDINPAELGEEDGANVDLYSQRKGKTAVIKTSTRQTFFLPLIGLEYSDIGGLDKQIQEMVEAVVLPLTHKEKFTNIGISPPKGVLLYGPPGTGKTLLARACAAQTKATFLKLAGPQLVQMFIGEGAKLVRDAFSLAKEKAPAIVFIDELDAIGTKRFNSEKAGDREVQRTMLELLSQLDGFSSRADIKVIAATNRVDVLDPALLRWGRLNLKMEFLAPDEEARARIMQIHSRKMNFAKEVNFEELARCTDGFNGAQCKADYIEAVMEVQARKKANLNYYV
ncbi:hypothetical protein HPB48_016405 [Haemaphysalis longicornis]|uniref:AAA+ ATPase domain-containing protein n=1 Tax=Haemaphysalis longicornis TaxID=44386 RepID=A0A9J6FS19_HAELO|nr:hypothetical protein HPB48_016405 [Haemaphysalis longicornis]